MIKMQSLSSLLALLLFLSLVHSCNGSAGRETVVVFKIDRTKISYKGDKGVTSEKTPGVFRSPMLVGGMFNNKEFLAVICGVRSFDMLGSSPMEGVAGTSYANHKIWSAAKMFTNDTQTSTTHIHRGDFTAVIKEDKIYVLSTSFLKKNGAQIRGRSNNDRDPLMFVGTVTDSKDLAVTAASINWEEGKLLKNALVEGLSEAQASVILGGLGNGMVTKSGAIVFPIQVKEAQSKDTSSILYSKDNGSTWNIGATTENRTFDGSVIEWGNDKLLLIVASSDGYRKVYESENMGGTWKESLMLSRVWGNRPNRVKYGRQGSAIKVPVDEREVLLFAHPLNKNSGNNADTLQLWLSDGLRIVLVRTISERNKEHHTGKCTLAHVGDHLYIMHEINPQGVSRPAGAPPHEWSGVTALTHLPEFWESAKTKARAWQKLDTKYETKGVPTDGLVGFLGSANTEDSVWTDMYNCVHATVSGGESVSGGFKFNGEAESGAQWPVSRQGQNQVYIFTKKQFTLAATVIIHAASEKDKFSLIGASLDSEENNVLFGLGYTHDNKWFAVGNDKEEIPTEKEFVLDKEYHVALTFSNRAAAVFVDGKEIAKKELEVKETDTISHFYMGGMGQSSSEEKGSSCTVKNVMLFNRNLEETQIAKLTEVSKNNNLEEQTTTELTTVTTEESKSVSPTKPNKASLPSLEKVTNGNADDKKISKSQQELLDGVLKKNTKNDTSAAVSLCAVGWVCLVCSFTALMGL